MTCRQIYLEALAILGESVEDDTLVDYASRAPYLMTLVLFRFLFVSDAMSETPADRSKFVGISLDDEFPLDERLSSAAALALACLIITPELPELSDTLNKRAELAAQTAAKEASALVSTKEVYPG